MISLALSYLVATLALYVAYSVFRPRPRNLTRVSFAIALFAFSLWLIVAYIHYMVPEPGDVLVTWEYRVVFFAESVGSAFLALFGLAFLREGRIGRRALALFLALTLAPSLLNFTGLVIRHASFTHASLTGGYYIQEGGPLIAFSIGLSSSLALFMLACVFIRWRRSRGQERARAAYILAGFGVYVPLVVIFMGIVPALLEKDFTSEYVFPLAIIPYGMTAYALLRHRLLDVRLAVRRVFSYLLTIFLFGAPFLLVYLLFTRYLTNRPQAVAALSLASLAACVALSPVALRLSSRLSSRLFFPGLYDEVELLHEAMALARSREDLRDGIQEALLLVAERLMLEELWVEIPVAFPYVDERSSRLDAGGGFGWEERGSGGGAAAVEDAAGSATGDGDHHGRRETKVKGVAEDTAGSATGEETAGEALLLGCRREGGLLLTFMERGRRSPHFPPPCPLLAGEEAEEDGECARAREEMREKGAQAAFALHGVVGSCGTLLVGGKARGFSLDPLDVDLLESLARSLGPLVESHLQSLELTLRLEEVERARRELEESDRFKTDIINITSHEFRTPVTVLYGFTTTLGRRMEEMDREEVREGLTHIEAAAARLRQVLDKFLTVSLLRSGKEKPVPVPCGVSEFLEQVLSPLSGEERRRLRVEGRAEGLFIETDPRLLSLVLANLLENAFRFSDDFSPVTLRVAEEKGAVLLSVEDRGEGIEPEKLEFLFSPFTRLGETDKHGKGTGLGLYIVRMCADLLGLDVRVDSAPGRGSRFAVLVPGGRLPHQR